MEPRDICSFCLRQLIDIPFGENDGGVGLEIQRKTLLAILEPPEGIERIRFYESAQKIDQSRTANSLCQSAADDAIGHFSAPRELHSLYRTRQCSHAARDSATFESRTRRTRSGEDLMSASQNEFGVCADVHECNEPILIHQVDCEHACRRVSAHMPADDRRAVDPRFGMNGKLEACGPRGKAGRLSKSLLHLKFGEGPVRTLTYGVDAQSEEQIAHRGIPDHCHLIDCSRVNWKGFYRMAHVSGKRALEDLRGMVRIVLYTRHDVRPAKALGILK